MALITQYDKKDYFTLLGADTLDASQGTLFQAMRNITANNSDISILIGVGGMGVRILDHLKREFSQKMQPGWETRIGFLGIDSDYVDLDNLKYLNRNECVCVFNPTAEAKIQNPAMWSEAWNAVADHDVSHHLHPNMNSRLKSKLNIHDKPSSGYAIDQQIVDRLQRLASNLGTIANHGRYKVYVIGSLCGNFGSTAFVEMPALIYHAMGSHRTSIYAMACLPDIFKEKTSEHNRLAANAFAALKELDYYSGIHMRSGYSERFPSSVYGAQFLRIDSNQRYYERFYLIGPNSNDYLNCEKAAKENITAYLMYRLGYGSAGVPRYALDQFDVNCIMQEDNRPFDPVSNKTLAYSRHSAPKIYGTMGCAECSVPIKTVRAYVISEVCKKAGIMPVSKEERDAIMGTAVAGASALTLPFRGEDHYLSATEGTQIARSIIEPLERLLREVVYTGTCNLSKDTSFNFDWETVINQRLYANPNLNGQIEVLIRWQTDDAVIYDMAAKMRTAYHKFTQNVMQFVTQEGPLAYVNLYYGHFIPTNGESGIGIREMLRNICVGQKADGSRYPLYSVDEAARMEAKIREAVANFRPSLAQLLQKKLGRDDPSGIIEDWKNAVQTLVIARINEAHGQMALGNNGLFQMHCFNPAGVLCDNLYAFGQILSHMADIYSAHGDAFKSFDCFGQAADSTTQLNLANISHSIYNWVKQQADNAIALVSASQVRTALIQSFFEDMLSWLDVPDRLIYRNSDRVFLTNKDVAIPARQMFDSVIAAIVPNNLDTDLPSALMQAVVSPGDYDELAKMIITGLARKSKPLFNGTYPLNSVSHHILYPQTLNRNGFHHSLQKAVQEIFLGAPVNLCPSTSSNSIRMYQLVAPMELYHLTGLPKWEQAYESNPWHSNRMHGFSPSVKRIVDPHGEVRYVDPRPWEYYPSPCLYPNGAKNSQDSVTNRLVREGMRQVEIDKVIAEARRMGLLYAENTDSGWLIKSVVIDQILRCWSFSIDKLPVLPNGFFPTDKELVTAVAAQNSVVLEDISRPVMLDHAGILSAPASTETYAWENAAEVLYYHIPMLDELSESMAWFRQVDEEVCSANNAITKSQMPAQFVHILHAGLIYEADSVWKVKTANGDEQIAHPSQFRSIPNSYKHRSLNNSGLLYAVVFESLNRFLEIKGKDIFDELFIKATNEYKKLILEIDEGNTDAEEDMTARMARVNPLLAEIERVKTEYGADFSQNSMNPEFMRKMAELDISETEAQTIFDFYRCAAQWQAFFT